MDPEPTAATLKRWALEAGFTRAGIASLEPSVRGGEALRRWLERGDHAGMNWMARRREVRADPARLLPGPGALGLPACLPWYFPPVLPVQAGF